MQRRFDDLATRAVVTHLMRFIESRDIVWWAEPPRRAVLNWQHQLQDVQAIESCADAALTALGELPAPRGDEIANPVMLIRVACRNWLSEAAEVEAHEGRRGFPRRLPYMRNKFVIQLARVTDELADQVGARRLNGPFLRHFFSNVRDAGEVDQSCVIGPEPGPNPITVALVEQLVHFLDAQNVFCAEEDARWGFPVDATRLSSEVSEIGHNLTAIRQAMPGEVRYRDELDSKFRKMVFMCHEWHTQVGKARLYDGEQELRLRINDLRITFSDDVMAVVEELCSQFGVETPMKSPSGRARIQSIEDQLDAEDVLKALQPKPEGDELDGPVQ